jgi:cytochrome P450 family 6
MARFTTDVIASCAFGINSNSLKDPDAEFRRYTRTIFDLTLKRGLAFLLSFVAQSLKNLFRLKFVEDKTTNYIRQIVWSTVEYR